MAYWVRGQLSGMFYATDRWFEFALVLMVGVSIVGAKELTPPSTGLNTESSFLGEALLNYPDH